MKVRDYLAAKTISYEVVEHRPTFTAQHTAQATHVRGDDVAKTVVLKAGGRFVLAVLQATHHVDLKRTSEVLHAADARLASETEFQGLFSDCEPGSLPPFGSQYGLKTLVDEPLTHHERILIEGNTHQEAIRIRYADFERVEQPQVANLSYRG